MRAPTEKERGRKRYGRRTWHNLQIKLRQDVIQHTCPTWRREKIRYEQQQWAAGESSKFRVVGKDLCVCVIMEKVTLLEAVD